MRYSYTKHGWRKSTYHTYIAPHGVDGEKRVIKKSFFGGTMVGWDWVVYGANNERLAGSESLLPTRTMAMQEADKVRG